MASSEHDKSNLVERKAAELGIPVELFEKFALEQGWTDEQKLHELRRFEINAEFAGDGSGETSAAAAATAREEARAAVDRSRDRSSRGRVAGYQVKAETVGEKGKPPTERKPTGRKVLVPTGDLVPLRPATPEEKRKLGEVALWVRWLEAHADGDGVSQGMVERVEKIHAILGLGIENRIEQLIRVACRIALLWRLAGNRPPPEVPGTGREIVESAKRMIERQAWPTPAWLDHDAFQADLDGILRTSTLARGGGGKVNVDGALDDLFGKLRPR
jgi:hypothetical protein